ncbi:hypothetical protein [Micromonospora sp. NBC_00860]|uniref:hypothetical protein n=1 Tax=Micromonospora sp. NBC_00860 TaxID=2975980 RepID=UPI00386496B8|nr:hypothetical protein OH804_04865 [Micromonospora sp. NBC_00860]
MGSDLAELVLAASETQLMRLLDSWANPTDPRLTSEPREVMAAALPSALLLRYQESGNATLLDRAITFIRGCLHDGGFAADLQSSLRSNLATFLLLVYERTGAAALLQDAIATFQAVVDDGTARGDELAGRLAALGHSYALRADGFNSPDDLDRAITSLHAAVTVPGLSADKAAECWSDLAGAWRDKYARSKDPAALANAVNALRQAVRSATPGTRPELVNRINLAGTMRIHAGLIGDLAELDESIRELLEIAAGPTPDGHHLQYNLGRAYLERHKLTGADDDLTEAISALQGALVAADADGQRYARIALDLAGALIRAGNGSGAALRLITIAARHPSATVMTRFEAATAAAQMEAAPASLAWWRAAVDLLPVLAWRGSRHRDRQMAIKRSAGAARTAAACASAIGEPAEAVSMLETGRTILWNQLLEARAGLDELAAARPDLAERMIVIRRDLDRTHHG